MEIILALFLYVIFCLIAASVGSGKKIGYWGTFFISLFLSPIVGFIVALVSANQKVGSDAVKLISQSDKEIKKGNIPNAISLLNRSLTNNPNPFSHYKLAGCYSLLQDKEKSLMHLGKAVELGYSNFDKIEIDPRLTWIREQPEFAALERNDFKVSEPQPQDHISKLKDLADLKERNMITEEEYNAQKSKLLTN